MHEISDEYAPTVKFVKLHTFDEHMIPLPSIVKSDW